MHCCWHWRSGKNSFFIILPFRRTLHSIVFQYIIYWKNYWHSSNINEWMWINPDDPSSSDNESPHRKSISRFLQCASYHLCVGASDLQCGKMAGLWHEYQWWRWQHLNPEHCSSIQSQLLHLGRGKHQLSSLPSPTRNSKPLPASVTRLSTLLCPWISHKFKETKHRRWKGQRTSCGKSHIVIIITFRSLYHFTASRWAGHCYSEHHNKRVWTMWTSFDAK